MKFFNATPHDIHVYNNGTESDPTTYNRSGHILRIGELPTSIRMVDDVPCTNPPVFDKPDLTMPENFDRSNYDGIIVAALVARYFYERGVFEIWGLPIYSPNTGPKYAVRSETGQIKGCTALIKWE
jgi:hypothetical protein